MTELWNSGSQNYGLSGQSPFSMPFAPRPYTGYGSAYGGQYGLHMPNDPYFGSGTGVDVDLYGNPITRKKTPSIFSGGISSTGQPIGGGGGFTLGLGGYGFGGTGTGGGATPVHAAGIPRPTFETGGTSTTGGASTGFPTGAYPNPLLNTAITGLLTPGLVPDIARQSAEISAGRGIGGSPAGASTAVRMSEADWLQRLGLANTLLSGEAGRNLPYQITPYQQSQLDLQRKWLENQQFNQAMNNYYRYQGGYGGGRSPYGGGGGYGGGRIGAPVSSYSGGGGTGFGNLGPGPFGSWSPASSLISGGGLGSSFGGGGNVFNLDSALQELGIYGDNNGVTTEYGTDFGQFPEPPDFNYDMWE